MVEQIKKELTEKVIAVRENLLEDIVVIDFLLKTSAGREPTVRALLKGSN